MSSAEYYREYYRKHREEILARQKTKPSRNLEENRAYMKVYYEENKARWQQYRDEHRDERNARRREKYANDPAYREKAKESANEHSRTHRARYPYRRRALTHGISETAVELLMDAGCAVCGAKQYCEPGLKLHVDHDHRTGKVRGVLCSACNLALGHLNDDPLVIAALLQYILRAITDE